MKYNTFRNKMELEEDCILKWESAFISEGTSATEIFHIRLDINRKAAIVVTEKEGPDTNIIFTLKEDNPEQELLKSDYYIWDNKNYFVYEDVDLVKKSNYKKQKSYECNVSFIYKDKTYYAYFVSSLAKYLDTTLVDDLIITDNAKPVLIMPYQEWLETNIKIVIKGVVWKIIDFDIITNDGIAYISLDKDFISNSDDIIEEKDINNLKSGIILEIDTNFGYFKTSVPVEIVSKTSTKVNYIIPIGIQEITITTKNSEKLDIINTYKVV